MKKLHGNWKLKLTAMVVFVLLSIGTFSMSSTSSSAAIVDEQFNDPTLSSDWVISPGRGSYSLTANPGHLRYIIDAWHVSALGPAGGYAKALHLIRPFSGDQWTLSTKIIYNMRPGSPTNNRIMYMGIIKPGDFSVCCVFNRWVGVYDSNPWSNSLGLGAGDGVSSNSTSIFFPNSPGPLPLDTMYFEIVRNGDHIVIKASTDGDTTFEHQMEYTFSPGKLGLDQEIVLGAGGWWGSNSPPGYADIDFIKVVPNTIPATIDIDPDTLNLKSKGKWITGYIDLPSGYDASDINISTVKLNDAIPADWGEVQDTTQMVKFDRSDVEDMISTPSENVDLIITGKLIDGTDFEGNDMIRAIKPP